MTTAVAWMAPVCALIGICMAAYLGSWVLKQDPGPDKMNSISIKIQQGAKAFLMSEYKLLVIFMVVVGIIMAVALSPITALAFATAYFALATLIIMGAALAFFGAEGGDLPVQVLSLSIRAVGCQGSERQLQVRPDHGPVRCFVRAAGPVAVAALAGVRHRHRRSRADA